MTPLGSRIHGLDTLRALAVTLVVLHHYVLFVSGTSTFGWVGDIGWTGVDLFFALSGYLIGGQIFQALRSPQGFSLKRFYARRLLRTLPNFWVVLALYALWPAFRGSTPMLPLWKYLTFTQNYHLEPGTAFSHAWSLCIEEQFYMLLPACALLGVLLARRVKNMGMAWAWAALLLAFGAGMAARAGIWLEGGGPGGHLGAGWQHYYYKYIYYSSFCRADELLAGVGLAMLKHCHPQAWQRVLGHGRKLLAAGCAVIAFAFAWFLHDRDGFLPTLLGFPLLALGFSLLILAALAPGSLLYRVKVPGAASLALWSYAVYLVHKQVSVMVGHSMAAQGFGPEALPTIVLALAASLLAGWLLYRLVETPFMRLRARYVPANTAHAAPAPASPLSGAPR